MTATAAVREADQQRTYGNWRRGLRAGLFGLGPIGTVAAFAVMVVSAALLAVSFVVALIAAVVGTILLAPLSIRVNGRTGLQVLSARIVWWLGRSRRHHMYISGVASRASGAHQLPGILARSEVYEVETGRAGMVAVVVIPPSRHYTVTLRDR